MSGGSVVSGQRTKLARKLATTRRPSCGSVLVLTLRQIALLLYCIYEVCHCGVSKLSEKKGNSKCELDQDRAYTVANLGKCLLN